VFSEDSGQHYGSNGSRVPTVDQDLDYHRMED